MFSLIIKGLVKGMKLSICDDDILCIKTILDVLQDYVDERKDYVITYDYFQKPEDLLVKLKAGNSYDIFLLDIVMPCMNGIELGQSIRNMGIESKIIYLTSSPEYALDSFRVRAFDYLMKPILKANVYDVLDEAINSIYIRKDKSIIIKTRFGNARITLDSILYAELTNRIISYHLKDGQTIESTTIRSSFNENVKELLNDSRFYNCGASIVVNLHHISAVETKQIIFQQKKYLSFSQKLSKDLRFAWNNYWISQEG